MHGGGKSIPLGPDKNGKHRVMVPGKTARMNKGIEQHQVSPITVEVEMAARNGGAIRYATLVTNQADS